MTSCCQRCKDSKLLRQPHLEQSCHHSFRCSVCKYPADQLSAAAGSSKQLVRTVKGLLHVPRTSASSAGGHASSKLLTMSSKQLSGSLVKSEGLPLLHWGRSLLCLVGL